MLYDLLLIQVCGPPGMMEHVSGGKAPDWSQGEVCSKSSTSYLGKYNNAKPKN